MTKHGNFMKVLVASAFLSLGACGHPEAEGTATQNQGLLNLGDEPGAPTFTFEAIEFPGARQSIPLVQNGDGVISGWYTDSANHNHGFTWNAGVYATVDVPGATDTYLMSVYGSKMDGSYRDSDGHVHGFLFSNGTFTTLDVPGAAYTSLYPFEVGTGLGTSAITMNAQGVIVGEYATDNGVGHGFILNNGVYTTVDHPQAFGNPGSNTLLYASNNDGLVVGRVTRGLPQLYSGFAYKNGVFTPIVPPKAIGVWGSQANGVNNQGDIVGVFGGLDQVTHGFLYTGGHYYTIDYPGGVMSEVHSVNDNGDIIGAWADITYSLHGYIGHRNH